MNSVERIKAICKERKIAISKLERDLGFANGYIGQLRKGVLPDDRLLQVSEYLNLSVEYLMTGEQKEKPAIHEDDRLKQVADDIRGLSDKDFEDLQRYLRFLKSSDGQ